MRAGRIARHAPWPLAVALAACAGGPRPETRIGPGLLAGGPAAPATLARDPRTLTFPALAFDPPAALVLTRPSGLKVFFLPDPELPLVELLLVVGLGTRDDPPDHPGAASLLGRTLAAGGAGDRGPDAFAEAAEGRAIEVDVSLDDDLARVHVSALAADAPLAMALLADLVRRPLYDAGRLEIERGRAIEAVRRRNDEPQAIAARELRAALYGAGSPWARLPTQAELAAVTRDDLVALHRRHFTPANCRLAVVGDLDRDRLDALLAALDGWEGGPPERAPRPDGEVRSPGPARLLAIKEGTAQAVVLMGQPFIPRHHPDRHATDLMNYILGGGVFQSRLGEAIRSDRGLAYAVSSGVRRLGEADGHLYVLAATKPATQAEVMRIAEEVVTRMHDAADVSTGELARAKDAFLNSHVFHYATATGVAFEQATLDHYGYAPDWLLRYPDRIEAVTAADIARVAREHLRPEALATVLVTPAPPPAEPGRPWTPVDLGLSVR